MRTFIGLTGVKGSGKTTSFEIIKKAFPAVIEVTLASRLKDTCSKVLGIPREALDDPAVKEKELENLINLDTGNVTELIESFGLKPNFDAHIRPHLGKVLHTPREAAQYVGTEVLRNVEEQVHCLGATLDLPETGIFVVTDMRFWNEYNFFAENDECEFFPFFVHNYGAEAQLGENPHASEKYVLEIGDKCQRIDNNGTIAELETKVLAAFEDVLAKRKSA